MITKWKSFRILPFHDYWDHRKPNIQVSMSKLGLMNLSEVDYYQAATIKQTRSVWPQLVPHQSIKLLHYVQYVCSSTSHFVIMSLSFNCFVYFRGFAHLPECIWSSCRGVNILAVCVCKDRYSVNRAGHFMSQAVSHAQVMPNTFTFTMFYVTEKKKKSVLLW